MICWFDFITIRIDKIIGWYVYKNLYPVLNINNYFNDAFTYSYNYEIQIKIILYYTIKK